MEVEGKQVILIHEPGQKSDDVVEIIKLYHDISPVSLDVVRPSDFNNYLLAIIDVDLHKRETVNRLRQLFELDELSNVPRLFVLEEIRRRNVMQAYSLGGQSFVTRPLRAVEVLSILRPLINKSVEEQWNSLNKMQAAALKVSLKVFEDMMTNAQAGEPLPAQDIRENADLIIQATAREDLMIWMNAVRDHHNYTFSHSMLVCGFLVSFAHQIGIRGNDLQTLAVGGILHDVGKAITPLEILDKPGRLTKEEWEIMRQHPADGRRILLESGGWDADIIDCTAHHHEKLDGTGYPDGLAGNKISDLARMISIADVFSALVDKRTYKSAMKQENAYKLMLGMHGHLDMPLIKAFEPIASRISNQSLRAGKRI